MNLNVAIARALDMTPSEAEPIKLSLDLLEPAEAMELAPEKAAARARRRSPRSSRPSRASSSRRSSSTRASPARSASRRSSSRAAPRSSRASTRSWRA